MPGVVAVATSVLIGAALTLAPVMAAGPSAPAVVHGPPPGVVTNPDPGPRPEGPSGTTFSRNWSGYGRSEAATTSVACSWTVPAVPVSGPDAYSASWVGVDGYGNGQLIQAGTGQDTENGQSFYFAWWEVLPAAETVIASIVVSPGDRMTAAIARTTPGTWTITVDDLTTGRSFSGAEPYDGSGASAEWIEEAPIVDGEQSTLADFKTVDFSGARADGANADLLPTQGIDMIASSGVIAHPSLPGVTTDDFAVEYGHSGAPVITVPGSPTRTRAVAGRRDATVSWKAPADTGGVPITSYTVTMSSAGRPLRQISTGKAVTTLAIAGLADGTRYTFTVAARNAIGTGRPSASSPAVIPSSAPRAPAGAA